MKIRFKVLFGYAILATGSVAAHLKGTKYGTVAEIIFYALAPLLPAIVSKEKTPAKNRRYRQ